MEAPLCDCHGEPMMWHKRPRRKNGGQWDCRVMKRAAALRWYHKADGGWLGQRQRQIAHQRGLIRQELADLKREREALC